jgi:glyoxylase-like metal-dependent hydrolase (beta-lactamase superfamily II)
MKTQRIGQFTIDRVTESEGAFAPVEFVLPEVDMDRVRSESDWLVPDFLDAQNRLVMSFHSYVLRTPRYNILIDACVGNDKERPLRASWHRQKSGYLSTLAQVGLQPEQIDFVLCTHLHADHVGWNTRQVDGRWVPTFSRARYVFSAVEYHHWEHEHRQALSQGLAAPNHGSFADSVLPVVDAGQAMFVQGSHELDDGIQIQHAPGHTPGNCVLHARSQGAHAVFSGDILHTPVQLIDLSWSSRFCHDRSQAEHTRRTLVGELADSSSLLMAAHFPAPVAGRIVSASRGLRWQAAHSH